MLFIFFPTSVSVLHLMIIPQACVQEVEARFKVMDLFRLAQVLQVQVLQFISQASFKLPPWVQLQEESLTVGLLLASIEVLVIQVAKLYSQARSSVYPLRYSLISSF